MLFLITNRKCIGKGNLISVIEEGIKAGVDVVLLREKDLSYEELLPIAMQIQALIKNTKTKLIVNGNLQVAAEANAEGYHEGFQKFMKRKFDFQGLKGVSVHSVEEAMLAEKQGADYLLAGHVFETDCKKGLKGRGLQWIEEMKAKVDIPVIALGGITLENVAEVVDIGIDGIAIMSGIMGAESPYAVTRSFKKAIEVITNRSPTRKIHKR